MAKVTAREENFLRAVTLSGNRIGFEKILEAFEGLGLNVTTSWMHVDAKQFDEWARPFFGGFFYEDGVRMVDPVGIEPTTCRLRVECSAS